MTQYLRAHSVTEPIGVEIWEAPEGKTPAECFHQDVAALFHEKGDADLRWIWNGTAWESPPPKLRENVVTEAQGRLAPVNDAIITHLLAGEAVPAILKTYRDALIAIRDSGALPESGWPVQPAA